jgi:DNA polymerase
MPGGTVILDVETRSTLDLRRVGAARYAAHPATDLWCVAWAVDDQQVQLWLPNEPVPKAILEATVDSDCVFIAHNAGFERAVLKHILTPRYNWPEIPVERWRCTMTESLALALPASLAKVAKALSLPEQKANKSIVALMAKPRRPRGDEDPNNIYWFDDPEHLQALYDYCRQDVETERELFRRLLPLIPAEQELWRLDQRINDRGFYVDGDLPEKANAIVTAAERAIQAELQQITGGEVASTNQVAKLIAWLAAHDCIVTDLQKGTLSQALRRKELAPEVRRVIELRREAAHASAAKMPALRAWRCVDGRVRGAFKFHGAATGRWSGSGPQPQNLKKEAENTEAKLAAVLTGDIEAVRKVSLS